MNDKEFLTWIYQRMVYVYKENPLYDYMHRLRWIIDATPDTQVTNYRKDLEDLVEDDWRDK